MDGKINDQRGNSFKPTREQAMLHKAGWILVERRRQGCVWIVRWYDRKQGDICNQGTAVLIQRERKQRANESPKTEIINSIAVHLQNPLE
jgi:hypothetical protein